MILQVPALGRAKLVAYVLELLRTGWLVASGWNSPLITLKRVTFIVWPACDGETAHSLAPGWPSCPR